MTRVCTVCTHSAREAIDAALVTGGTLRTIADRWQVSKTALLRHRGEHLPAHLTRAKDAAEVASADALLAQVGDLHRRTLALLDTAEDGDDIKAALAAIREARGNLELLAKLVGQLGEQPPVALVESAEFLAVRAALMAALAPFPAARVAVAQALMRLEAGDGGQ